MTISSETPNADGQYQWMIPAGLNNSENYQIKINDATDESVYGISENFEIFYKTITGYNPLLLLCAMVGISVILSLKKRENNLIS